MTRIRTASRENAFVKQASVLVTAGLLARLIGFVYRIPLTNLIGDPGNAIYAAGYYIYAFLLVLSSAGLPVAISKMVAERIALKQYRNAHRVFQTAMVTSCSLGTFFAIILVIFGKEIAALSGKPESYHAILTLVPTLVLVAAMSVFRGYFQGMNTMVPTAVSQIVEQVLNAIFSVYLAYAFLQIGVAQGEKNIALGAAGGTAGTGVGALAGLIVVVFCYSLIHSKVQKRVRHAKQAAEERKLDLLRELLFTAWPIILGTAIFSLTNIIDVATILHILQGSLAYTEEQASILYGQFTGKYLPLSNLPAAISTALSMAVIPSIAMSMKLKDRRAVSQKTHLTFRLSMIVSAPAAVGLGFMAGPIYKMLFFEEPGGAEIMMVGAAAIVFIAVFNTATGILQGTGHVKLPVIAALVGAVVKVVLNIALLPIPQLNIYGAAISTTVCYLVAAALNLYLIKRFVGITIRLKDILLKPLMASILMGIFSLGAYYVFTMIFPSATFATLFAIMFAMIFYVLFMLLIGGFKEEDIRSLPKGDRMANLLITHHLI